MASINEIKNYIDIIFKQSLDEYKKLAASKSLNDTSRDRLANSVLNKHLTVLMKKVEIKEAEISLIVREVTHRLIKN